MHACIHGHKNISPVVALYVEKVRWFVKEERFKILTKETNTYA
jgi:hypothetical protein